MYHELQVWKCNEKSEKNQSKKIGVYLNFREFPDAIFLWHKTIKQGIILLSRLMKHARIQLSCQKVVSRCDGVNIAGQMQVKVFHWNHLGISTAGSATCNGNSIT